MPAATRLPIGSKDDKQSEGLTCLETETQFSAVIEPHFSRAMSSLDKHGSVALGETQVSCNKNVSAE